MSIIRLFLHNPIPSPSSHYLSINPFFVRYPIPTREAGNALVITLRKEVKDIGFGLRKCKNLHDEDTQPRDLETGLCGILPTKSTPWGDSTLTRIFPARSQYALTGGDAKQQTKFGDIASRGKNY
ncbi:hypothetical protein EVAR_61531_1 [Eumeta japonica]|uniref:Uncharacterized protein n=1 Tax=Eumeta variegata TaxID=151549 RepID=A0A4C1YVC2_EUMVA|nr:hypothetical protein EVAR_61531_1 [Eumeta japonica]